MKYVAYGNKEDKWGSHSYQLCYGDSVEEIEAKLIKDGFKKGKDGNFRGWYFIEGCYEEGEYLEPFCDSHYVEVSIESVEDL